MRTQFHATTFLLVAVALSLLILNSSAQADWEKTFGGTEDDGGSSMQQTKDGGYIIAGRTNSFGAGGDDVYLVKTDADGNQQWQKTFGGAEDDGGSSVQQTKDGGYVIAGRTNSFGTGGWDFYLVRTDALGNQQWTKTFGGTKDEIAYSAQQTTDGGYVIAGYTDSFGAGGRDVYLIKTDALGNQQWEKTFGGAYGDYGYSVRQTKDGGYIIAGQTSSFTGGWDIYVIKTDAMGIKMWEKAFGGASSEGGGRVQETIDGGYIITGEKEPSVPRQYDVYLIKIDAAGNE